MARKNPVHKEYLCVGNGQIYRGRSVKPAKVLAGRIRDYENFCATSQTEGKEFNKPGSLRG